MRLFSYLRSLKKSFSPYKRFIEILIFKDHILHNLKAYREKALPAEVAPVIKSNAYGHGLIEVARILDRQGVPFLVVDSLYEARRLRYEGITSPILVVGYTPTENILSSVPRKTTVTVATLEQLAELAQSESDAVIHIKIDTGMHRQGIQPREIKEAIKVVQESSLVLEGICSHFADADGETDEFTNRQIATWNTAVEEFQKVFPTLRYMHLSATAGIRLSKEIRANVVRLGKGLYGINPVPRWPIELKPALEMRTVISAIRTLGPGERVGYNGTFETKHETRVATVPVGYYEGVDRRLSNKGAFEVHGKACPILGRISMNISSLDVTDVPDAKIGDAVTVISADRDAPNSVENIAKRCNTISYDIVARIPEHLGRRVI